ncbi:MFS transporter [Planctomicrobium sp. SH527]|uniref:MFS transporter n=1 Tax=Planctomicrobium sp. SH527 TaxID=3448123 RepID=UPI003F5C7049
MNVGVIIRLSIMMFLQFFVWGSWYVTVGNYMTKHGMGDLIGNAYSVGPIAAIIAPLFLGLIADRYFATERVLAALHILGAAALFAAPRISEFVAPHLAGSAFIGILLFHMLCYMPTLGLTNTLTFHNIRNQEVEFPIVRVAGTIGWIVAGVVVSKYLKADELAIQFQVAAGASLLLGLYSLTLPHTAPPAKGQRATVANLLGLETIKLMKRPSFAIFILASFLICIPLSTYYAYAPVFVKAAGFESPAYTMSFGQWSEVFFMLAMPLFFARLGVKWMLLVGMLAWVVRYGLFSTAAESGATWMVLGGILLHGICYDFFFVTGYIYVDKRAHKAIRGQAQGFLVLVTQGLGMLIGAQISQYMYAKSGSGIATEALTLPQWQQFWMVPCIMAGVIMLLFAFTFRDDSKDPVIETEASEAGVHPQH